MESKEEKREDRIGERKRRGKQRREEGGRREENKKSRVTPGFFL